VLLLAFLVAALVSPSAVFTVPSHRIVMVHDHDNDQLCTITLQDLEMWLGKARAEIAKLVNIVRDSDAGRVGTSRSFSGMDTWPDGSQARGSRML
jgi:hypothetical protein